MRAKKPYRRYPPENDGLTLLIAAVALAVLLIILIPRIV